MILKRLLFIAKLAVSVGIISYLFYGASQDGQWQRLLDSEKQWHWIAICGLACLGGVLLGLYRWQLLTRAVGLPLRLVDSIRIGFIGLFFALFAFGPVGGDTLRAFYAARKVKDRVSDAVTSVLVDRMIGLLTMFSIAAIAFVFFDFSQLETTQADHANTLKYVGWFVTGCTSAGYVGLVVLFFSAQLKGTAAFKRLTEVPKIGRVIEQLVEAIGLYRNRLTTVAVAFLLSLVVNLCFVLAIYSLARGLTDNNPSFTDHLVIEPIAMVSNAVPLPGGIGGMEFAMKYLYLAFGSNNGVVVGFAFRFVILTVSAIGGVVWFLNRDAIASIEVATGQKPLRGNAAVDGTGEPE